MSVTSDKEGGRLPPAVPVNLGDLVNYQDGSIVSRTLVKRGGGTITLFAFDKGQSLSEHTVPFDAMVQVLDGQVELIIGGKPVLASSGHTVLMPANLPHSVNAPECFKMMLVMVREEAAQTK